MSEKTRHLFQLKCTYCGHTGDADEFKMLDAETLLLECPKCSNRGYFP